MHRANRLVSICSGTMALVMFSGLAFVSRERVARASDPSEGSVASHAVKSNAAVAAPSSVRVPLPSSTENRPFLGSERGPRSQATGEWWLGTAGIALVLVVCGAICLGARKYLPKESSGLLHVVGRVSLSPRHNIYLLKTDGRILLIGTGPQGAPSLLGELSGDARAEPAEPSGLAGPTRGAPRTREPMTTRLHATPRVDIRLGDDE